MPFIAIRTTVECSETAQVALLQECSQALARLTGKPETYVMTLLEHVPAMTMAGTAAPACFVEVRGVGAFSSKQTASISQAVCKLLSDRLAIPSARVYLNFIGFEGSMWGYDGSTFG